MLFIAGVCVCVFYCRLSQLLLLVTRYFSRGSSKVKAMADTGTADLSPQTVEVVAQV